MVTATPPQPRTSLVRYFAIGLAIGAGIALAMLAVNFGAAGLMVGLGAVVDTQ